MITHKGWNSSAQFGGYQEVAQTVKCLPAMWKTKVRSLDWEDPLEKETATQRTPVFWPGEFQWTIQPMGEKAMAPHFSTLAWKIPWMEEPGKLQSMGSLRVRHD